jgi:hypothetical protein
MKIKEFILFMIFSVFGISINAKTLATFENDLQVISWPKNCIVEDQENCSIKTHKDKKYSYKRNDLQIVLSENSILKIEKNKFTFIKGEFLILTHEEKHKFQSAKIKNINSADGFIIQIEKENTTIFALNDYVIFIAKGDVQALKLLPATSMKIGGVSSEGYIKEFPRLSFYKTVINKLGRLYPDSSKAYSEFMVTYRHNWKISSKKLRNLLEDNAKFLIKKQKDEDRQRKMAIKHRAQQEESLKNLFMQKNYIQ